MTRITATALLATLLLLGACEGKAPAAARGEAAESAGELRALALFKVEGTTAVDKALRERQEAAQKMDRRADHWIQLGRAWVEKARLSSDPGYYLHADAAAKTALQLEPDNGAAMNLRGLVLLNDHRFKEAKALAEQMLKKNPDDPTALGTLSDALLEMGDVDGAAQAAQSMMDIKPNLPSYARASWMKWLHGDVAGATEAIRLAYDAGRGQRDPEPSSWVLTEAATIFWHQGDYDGAIVGCDLALKQLPGYPPALVMKARALMSKGASQDAIPLLDEAMKKSASVEGYALLADARAAAGDAAGEQVALAKAVEHGARHDKRGLAVHLSERGEQLDQALAAIVAERATRGGPYTDDAYAWTLFKLGRTAEAKTAIESATKFGTKDARLLFHKGAILIAAGDVDAGRAAVAEALRINPAFDRRGVVHAKALLEAK